VVETLAVVRVLSGRRERVDFPGVPVPVTDGLLIGGAAWTIAGLGAGEVFSSFSLSTRNGSS
jgi:hypothetical protein